MCENASYYAWHTETLINVTLVNMGWCVSYKERQVLFWPIKKSIIYSTYSY